MAVVEVHRVTNRDPAAQLLGSQIDMPRTGDTSEIFALHIHGWVLGKDAPAIAVEVVASGGEVIRRMPLENDRPDVVTAYPTVPQAQRCGFLTAVSLLGLPLNFQLKIRAVLEDGKTIEIGTILGRRRPLSRAAESHVQPIIVATQGRTGSTWLMRILDQHPNVIAYRPFEHEPRVVIYWMNVLTALGEPNSYLQHLASTLSGDRWWLGDSPLSRDMADPEPEIWRLLGHDGVKGLATFSRRRVEEFYRAVAGIQSKDDPRFFAEKSPPNQRLSQLIGELYPKAREIFLVRDLRDMVCSMVGYSEKLRVAGFGQERASDDRQFVANVRKEADAIIRNYRNHPRSALLLRYEDLVTEPSETLKTLLEFLELEASPALVGTILEKASQDTPGMQMHRTTDDAQASIGRWRRDLSESLQTLCEEMLGDALAALGYGDEHNGEKRTSQQSGSRPLAT
jgi:hypothetical protein